jgi:hypothetical protein
MRNHYRRYSRYCMVQNYFKYFSKGDVHNVINLMKHTDAIAYISVHVLRKEPKEIMIESQSHLNT